jgi:hypothetical protein
VEEVVLLLLPVVLRRLVVLHLLVAPNLGILLLGILLQVDLLHIQLSLVPLVLLHTGCFGLIKIFELMVLCLVDQVNWVGLLDIE